MNQPLRTVVVVVAYNAEDHIRRTLERIPSTFGHGLTRMLIADDHSSDATYKKSLEYKASESRFPVDVIRHNTNLGYGGNQKFCYKWALSNDAEVVVMLHADGQYAPEFLPQMVEPILNAGADVVLGSRMLTRRSALRGGMPLYKFVGNKILTRLQNSLVGIHLSEWHTGYRAYRVSMLKSIPISENSNDFDFDTQIILQALNVNAVIAETPVPTFYGHEVSHVNGLKYGFQILRHTYRYHKQQRA